MMAQNTTTRVIVMVSNDSTIRRATATGIGSAPWKDSENRELSRKRSGIEGMKRIAEIMQAMPAFFSSRVGLSDVSFIII
jgi:hypothetical protein